MSQHAKIFAPPPGAMGKALDGKRDLVGLSRENLAAAMAELGEKPFRAKQLWHWIYHRGATDFAAMTTLSKDFRQHLAEPCAVRRPEVAVAQVPRAGTRTWPLRLAHAPAVEPVTLPERLETRSRRAVARESGCGDGRTGRKAVPRQAALALDLPPRRDRLRRHDHPLQGLPPAPRRDLRGAPARGRRRPGLQGRHPQVAAAPGRRPGG